MRSVRQAEAALGTNHSGRRSTASRAPNRLRCRRSRRQRALWATAEPNGSGEAPPALRLLLVPAPRIPALGFLHGVSRPLVLAPRARRRQPLTLAWANPSPDGLPSARDRRPAAGSAAGGAAHEPLGECCRGRQCEQCCHLTFAS